MRFLSWINEQLNYAMDYTNDETMKTNEELNKNFLEQQMRNDSYNNIESFNDFEQTNMFDLFDNFNNFDFYLLQNGVTFQVTL